MSGAEMSNVFGLVGFRCSGKSYVRQLLRAKSIPVFDTNSVPTGDADAKTISLKEIISRYGENRSYMYFVSEALKAFADSHESFFVDSFKTAPDPEACEEILPGKTVKTVYLHAPYEVRAARYLARDLERGIRTQSLEEHDKSLEEAGIWTLIKNANHLIDTTRSDTQIMSEIMTIGNWG
jgi:dephospho-CoA kinase